MNYAANMKSAFKKLKKKITLTPYSNLSEVQTSESSHKKHRVVVALVAKEPALAVGVPDPRIL